MILKINSEFRTQVNQYIEKEWAGPIVVTKGILHDTSNADGFISIDKDELTGYILYHIQNKECEILVLHSILENHGIGSNLIKSVIGIAKSNGCKRVWLITTNDNIHAIRYYQKFGFELKAVYINALDESRKLKPSIPQFGNEGIPIKHEFEFSYQL
ncbi:MAG: GNAT family N-acetyltransferase [Candidatus Merdivicinus sp.]|jgi:ribosomal protein S18 acetylase RimI-like enzyme